MMTAVISAPISRNMAIATMSAVKAPAPNWASCADPTNAMIKPTNTAINDTIGSAWAPLSCMMTAKSETGNWARPRSSRPIAMTILPTKSTNSRTESQAS